MKSKKVKRFLFSLFALCVIGTSGIFGYALVTGNMPPFINAISSNFASRPPSGISATMQTVSGSTINPNEITPSDSIAQVDLHSSTSSVDPDAKTEEGNVANQNVSYISTEPISITTSQDSTSSKPAKNTSSKAATSSSSVSRTPSSKPQVSSSPTSSGSSPGGTTSWSITGISLDKTELTINKGDISESLIPTITPSNATGDKTITWISSNDTIAAVDSAGHVAAVGPGTAQIIAKTSNGKTATCTVTVFVPATGIQINSEDFAIDKGSSKTLSATLTPADSTDPIIWSTSNSDILTVDVTGKITAINVGQAIITASAGDSNIKAECTVNVVISISSLTLDQLEILLFKGDEDTLTATIDPPDTTEDKTVTWTSNNPAVATVDSTGKVIAVGGGTAILSATAGTHYCECIVTIIVPVSGVSLNKSTTRLGIGTDETLTAIIEPEDATNKTVTWSSSDDNITTVDETGKVTAHNVGNVIITATTQDGGFTAECTVTAVIPVTGISLNKADSIIAKGNAEQLTATVTPATATDQAVTWTSSDNNIATVDQGGNVSAISVGNAVITATSNDGGFTANCNINVNIPINSITMSQPTAELRAEKFMSLSVAIDPPDTTDDTTVKWSSSDSNVATVDTTGTVTGINPGSVIISATVGAHTDFCTITVKPKITATIVNPTDLTASGHGTYVNTNGHIAITLNPSGNVGSYGDAYGHSVWVENTKAYQIKIRFSEPVELVSNVTLLKANITTSGGGVTWISNNGTSGEGPWQPRIVCTGWGYSKINEHVYTRQPETLLAYGQTGWGTTANLNYIYGGGYENNNTPTQTVSEISLYIYNEDIYHPGSTIYVNIGSIMIGDIPVIF